MNSFGYFIDISMLWILVGAASSFITFWGYKKFRESRQVGRLLENISKISESAGFYKLSKDETWFVEDFLSNDMLFSSSNLLRFKAMSGFVKKSGDADIYLTLVRREFRGDPEEKAVVDYSYHFLLFSHIDNSTSRPLIFHKKDAVFNNPGAGEPIRLENDTNNLNDIFTVRSLDICLEKTEIDPEIQKILLRYVSDYPFKSGGNYELSCLFISKRGITIIAPITPMKMSLCLCSNWELN